MKADLEPVNSLTRLGGLVSHLCREHPVTASSELEPLPVAPLPPLAPGPARVAAAAGGGSGGGAGSLRSLPPCGADARVAAAVAGRPALAAELLDAAMTLYALKVGSSVRAVSWVVRSQEKLLPAKQGPAQGRRPSSRERRGPWLLPALRCATLGRVRRVPRANRRLPTHVRARSHPPACVSAGARHDAGDGGQPGWP